MKSFYKLFLLFIVFIINMIILIACSNVNAESYENIVEEDFENTIIDIDTILDYRDSFKNAPTIEEIGEENLANYLFQQFNKELCYDIGNCFCHM